MHCIDNQYNMLFSMTNELENKVVVFLRRSDGFLSYQKVYKTGGKGTGAQIVDPLGSQGSIVISRDKRFLFLVNAGSNEISSFRINQTDLTLVDVIPSGGIFPNSLTEVNHNLYVTNSGNSPQAPSNVSGFHIDFYGHLRPLKGSKRLLSSNTAGSRCIVASSNGSKLAVSENVTNNISIYKINDDGSLSNPVVNPSNGAGPFGSSYLHNNILVVAEVTINAMSSYYVQRNRVLDVISASVLNNQTATCWISVTPDERYAYTSNAGSGTLTRYRINENGSLTIIESIPSTPSMTGGPIDSGIDREGQNFYVLNGQEGSISIFRIKKNGHLTLLQIYQNTRLPHVGAQGLAVL